MLPRNRLDLSKECEKLYKIVEKVIRDKSSTRVSRAWIHGLERQIAERSDDLTRFDMSGPVLTWNFATMLHLIRWTWLSLDVVDDDDDDDDEFSLSCSNEYAVWNRPIRYLNQMEFRDSLRALEIRWNTLIPSHALWTWIDQLDLRAAILCVRSDLGDTLNEEYDEIDGLKVSNESFIMDTASILHDMLRARFVHRDFMQQVHRVWSPPLGLPVEKAKSWIETENSYNNSEAREQLDNDLAKYSTRPGEMARYARARQGLIPDDIRSVIRHCRPPFSDYRKDSPMKPYLVFAQICKFHRFDWISAALLTEQDYFHEFDGQLRACDIMFNTNSEPTILRIMGADYVYRGRFEPGKQNAWRCSSPEEALCLWISIVSTQYESNGTRWDLKFLKNIYETWVHEPKTRDNKPVLVP